jgi:hypothetical protein
VGEVAAKIWVGAAARLKGSGWSNLDHRRKDTCAPNSPPVAKTASVVLRRQRPGGRTVPRSIYLTPPARPQHRRRDPTQRIQRASGPP